VSNVILHLNLRHKDDPNVPHKKWKEDKIKADVSASTSSIGKEQQ
jgi:hypothetical protein